MRRRTQKKGSVQHRCLFLRNPREDRSIVWARGAVYSANKRELERKGTINLIFMTKVLNKTATAPISQLSDYVPAGVCPMIISAVSTGPSSTTLLTPLATTSASSSSTTSVSSTTSGSTTAATSATQSATDASAASTSSTSSSSSSSGSSGGGGGSGSSGDSSGGASVSSSLAQMLASYNFSVGDKHYSSSITKSGEEYTASVAGVASASGSSESSVEAALSMRVSVMA